MRLASLACLLLCLAGICIAQDTNFPVGPQYLITANSTQFLGPIATPSLSFQSPLEPLPPATAESETGAELSSPPPAIQTQPNLASIYWGEPPASVIEMSSEESAAAVPPSLFNPGVTGMTDAKLLEEHGYGVTLAQDALYWKTHKRPAVRTFTNADIARLHGG